MPGRSHMRIITLKFKFQSLYDLLRDVVDELDSLLSFKVRRRKVRFRFGWPESASVYQSKHRQDGDCTIIVINIIVIAMGAMWAYIRVQGVVEPGLKLLIQWFWIQIRLSMKIVLLLSQMPIPEGRPECRRIRFRRSGFEIKLEHDHHILDQFLVAGSDVGVQRLKLQDFGPKGVIFGTTNCSNYTSRLRLWDCRLFKLLLLDFRYFSSITTPLFFF